MKRFKEDLVVIDIISEKHLKAVLGFVPELNYRRTNFPYYTGMVVYLETDGYVSHSSQKHYYQEHRGSRIVTLDQLYKKLADSSEVLDKIAKLANEIEELRKQL